MKTRIGILGYGNLGRGVECAIRQNPDMELAAVFTRRNPSGVKILTETAAVRSVDEAVDWKDKLDVLILCGGSATDLPVQTPKYAEYFNVVDSFDTHARMSTLKMWMRRLKRAERQPSSPWAGIPACFP